ANPMKRLSKAPTGQFKLSLYREPPLQFDELRRDELLNVLADLLLEQLAQRLRLKAGRNSQRASPRPTQHVVGVAPSGFDLVSDNALHPNSRGVNTCKVLPKKSVESNVTQKPEKPGQFPSATLSRSVASREQECRTAKLVGC